MPIAHATRDQGADENFNTTTCGCDIQSADGLDDFVWLGGACMFRSNLSLREVILIALLMLNGGSSASAEVSISDSANYAMPGCRNYVSENPKNGDLYKTGFCWGLISGLLYVTHDSCLPPGVTQVQAVRVVLQYIDNRPARMHEDFKILALEAMKAAWPCQR
jgi:hypothetical protein